MIALPQVTAQLLALESHVILSLQLGLGVSLSPATALAPFLQNLVDKVRLGRYVEMRDLLMDDIYVLCQLDILGIHMCPQACLSDSRQASIHC